MGRGIRIASDEDAQLDRRLERDAEHETRTYRPRERAQREAALIRYLKVGTR
jgi:hypothetical protein